MTAQVRPRPSWEAVDLGFMMMQRWWRPIIISWLVITLPVFLIINYFYYDRPLMAAFLFWWLLPVFDRIPMHFLSRALFGEVVSVRALLKNWTSVFLPHMIKSLTFYRLDFARSYNLPVWQLEKLKGRARAERSRVLKKLQYSSAVGLGLMCMMMEVIVFFGLFGLVMMFMPEYYAGQMALNLFEGEDVWWVGPLINLFVYLTFMIIEPFYVAGGFSLYINRRTELEGWDIEIVFRQLAQRLSQFSKAALLLITLALTAQVSFWSSEAVAKETSPVKKSVTSDGITNEQAKNTIQEIMDSDEFSNKKKIAGWYRKKKAEDEEDEDDDESSSKDSDFSLAGLDLFGNTLALSGQILLWMLVAALVVAGIYFYTKWRPVSGAGGRRGSGKAMPKSLFGMEITPESLPDDVGKAAMDLWNAGKIIEALSLLYRGALTTLMHRDGINLKGSATEGDCIRIVSQHAQKITQPTRDFFRMLTRQWQFAAYAHRLPNEQVMADLCNGWRQHFGAGS